MQDKTKLWHLRKRQISEKGLVELHNRNMLGGDKMKWLEYCDHYILGKSHKLKFETSKHMSNRPFKYAHEDLWGPMRAKTQGGGSCFLTITDKYLRRVWIYILKSKNKTFQRFKEWHTMVNNLQGTRLNVLRTYNDLEFVSEEFNKVSKAKVIKRHMRLQVHDNKMDLLRGWTKPFWRMWHVCC